MSNTNSNNKLQQDYTYPVDDSTTDDSVASTTIEEQLDTIKDSSPAVSEWYKYVDSLNKEQYKYIAELAKKHTYTIDGKEYQRKKITRKQFKELKTLMARSTKEKDPEKIADLDAETYEKMAEYYLGVTPAQFDDMDWDTSRLVLDSCMFRSMKGLPN